MNTWSTEVAALAAEIEHTEGLAPDIARSIAIAQVGELEQYAAGWDAAAGQDAYALEAYASSWDRDVAVQRVAV